MHQENNFFPQERWNTTYSNRDFKKAEETDPIVLKLKEYLPGGPGDTLEIGCCPGSYLVHLGYMGYTVHGLDLSPSVYDTRRSMVESGVSCGEFQHIDFFEYCKKREKTFDVVASFGFVEHFANFEEVFFLHTHLLADNGYLIMTFPNFAGSLQFGLHSLLDADGLSRHNTESMNVFQYEKMAKALKLDVKFAGYFGGFNFWSSTPIEEKNDPALVALESGIATINDNKALVGDHPAWSQYGGIVLQKTGAK